MKLTFRQRKILNLLQGQTSHMTSGAIAKSLRVSSRTVRNDIKEMNHILAPKGISIVSTQSKGFVCVANDPETIRSVINVDTAFLTKAERIRHLAFLLCRNDDPLNVYDLEEEIFVSHTTLLSDIQELKERYTYAPPNINITLKGEWLSVEQDEDKIRSVLLNLFHEDWDYTSDRNAFFGHHFLEDSLLMLLNEKTSGILHRYGLFMDDPTLSALNLLLVITHHRITLGYGLPALASPVDLSSPCGQATQDIFSLVEGFTGMSYNPTEKARICRFISSAHLSREIWQGQYYFDERIYREAFHYLEEVEKAFGVDFTKDSAFLRSLCVFFQQVMSGNAIFAHRQDSHLIRESLSAECEFAYLYQQYAPAFIGRFLTPQELSNLAVCFTGAIRHYLAVHPEKKLQTVLFCHQNPVSAWALKRKILESFDLYMVINDSLPVNFIDNYDFSNVDLVLITVNKTVSIPASVETVVLHDKIGGNAVADPMQIKLMSFRKICPPPDYSVRTLLENAWWHENEERNDSMEIIDHMLSDYLKAGIADEEHRSDIMQREQGGSFAIKPGLVFVYSTLAAKETKLSVMTLKHRVRWNDYRISTVVMALLSEDDRNLIFQLKIHFRGRSYNTDLLKTIRTKEELLPLLAE